MTIKKHSATHLLVRRAYGKVARTSSSCCPGSSCCGSDAVQVGGKLGKQLDGMRKAFRHSSASEGDMGLSCGDPVAFTKLKKGMTVVDLGSGAGKDVLLAAEKIGARGLSIGVDMTPEMLKLAAANTEKFTRRTGLKNVEFRKGVIEKLPVKDAEADMIISNCVINLSPDKPAVFREAFRALKPGGAIVVSDIVLNRALPPALKKHAGLYSSCVAGALVRKDYLGAIEAAGFAGMKLLSDRLYTASGTSSDPITDKAGKALDGAASSITVYAKKPARGKK